MALFRSTALAAILVLVGLRGVCSVESPYVHRGDANRDGWVGISDAYRILAWLQSAADPPPCMAAADANADGTVDALDAVYILQAIGAGGPRIPQDPGPEGDGCGPFEESEWSLDPSNRVHILSATAPGGDDSLVVLRYTVSNSTPLVPAIAAVFYDVDGVVQDVVDARLLAGPSTTPLLRAYRRWDDISWKFTLMADLSGGADPIPPSVELPLAEVTLCLKKGLPPGGYRISGFGTELTEAATGRRIDAPEVLDDYWLGSVVSVQQAVTGADSCNSAPIVKPGNVTFALGDAQARPGGIAAVPFTIRSDLPFRGYTFSIDFDETVLAVDSVVPVWQRADGAEYEFFDYTVNPFDDNPGSGGIDEGYVIGAATPEWNADFLPADTDIVVLELRFKVAPETTASSAEVRFMDWARGPHAGPDGGPPIWGDQYGLPVRNTVWLTDADDAAIVTADTAGSFVFLNGRVTVVPDAATFVRGDSTGDGLLDITDAVYTLTFLFLGGQPPSCPEAADLNDDGSLDIGDPIGSLTFLFLSGDRPPPPYPLAGRDPTPDDLGCNAPW